MVGHSPMFIIVCCRSRKELAWACKVLYHKVYGHTVAIVGQVARDLARRSAGPFSYVVVEPHCSGHLLQEAGRYGLSASEAITRGLTLIQKIPFSRGPISLDKEEPPSKALYDHQTPRGGG